MQKLHTKLTSQGQVSVPAPVRSFLNLTPGAVLAWTQEGRRVIVERATRHSTQDIHLALFPQGAVGTAPAKTLVELKQGLRTHVQRRHAGR